MAIEAIGPEAAPASPAPTAASGSASVTAASGQAFSLFPSLADVLAPAATGASGSSVVTGAAAGAGAGVGVGPGSGGLAAPGVEAPASLAALIDQVAQAHGLPANLLTALVQEESGFDPAARSSAGAMGLTQLMPGTAASLGVSDPWNASENLNGGATYLAGLLQSYHGNVALALAAYNAGPGAVTRWGGIPPYPQTQAYVRNILAMAGLSAPPAAPGPSG